MNAYFDNPEFDEVLARCMEDVQLQYRTVDECLQAYPQYADQLKPLLLTGLMTSRLKAPQLSPQAITAIENRLRTETRARNSLQRTTQRPSAGYGWQRLAAIFVVVVFLAFGSSAGLVAASSNALPGDPLYGIKRLWEAIVLALSPLSGPYNQLWQQIAETRLDEIERLAVEGRLTEQSLIDFYGAVYNLSHFADLENSAKVMDLMQDATSSLLAITPPAPVQAVYADVLALTQESVRSGIILRPPSALPASILQLTALPTLIPSATATTSPMPTVSATPTATTTITPTASITATATATATSTITPSRTPRIPATATKTITPLPTLTFTATASVTPTSTWTALPLPTFVPPALLTPVPQAAAPDASNTPSGDMGGEATRIRETEQSVFMTQTAGPPSATAQSNP